jgi:hypothetical protein
LYGLDRFDVLMSKMIFKKLKNIIGMHFGTKSYLKSTRNHTVKHALYLHEEWEQVVLHRDVKASNTSWRIDYVNMYIKTCSM